MAAKTQSRESLLTCASPVMLYLSDSEFWCASILLIRIPSNRHVLGPSQLSGRFNTDPIAPLCVMGRLAPYPSALPTLNAGRGCEPMAQFPRTQLFCASCERQAYSAVVKNFCPITPTPWPTRSTTCLNGREPSAPRSEQLGPRHVAIEHLRFHS
jgi:hypothetical protein